jgi:hypothetical protein
MGRVGHWLVSFGKFWYYFFIGEAPSLFIAALVVIALAFLLKDVRAAAIIIIPITVTVFLTASTYFARARA